MCKQGVSNPFFRSKLYQRGIIRRLERKIMETIKLRDEYIKLGQALKAAGLCESGVDAKYAIEDGLVKVNGNVEYQRGKKLRDGDEVTFQGETIRITL